MDRLSKLNIFLIGILILFFGYVLGSLTYTTFFNFLKTAWGIMTKNEIVTSSILIVVGWFISAYLDRKLASDQFVADKKFSISEILLKSLSKYGSSIISSTNLITKLQIDYNIPTLNSKYNGSTILSDIYQEWLSTSQSYIEFLQNCENYEIVLKDIKPLLEKFKNKTILINNHFQENFLLLNKSFSNFQANPILQQELIQLVKKTQELIWDQLSYIYDVRIGIQNRLLSKIFKNKVLLRKPTIDMDILS